MSRCLAKSRYLDGWTRHHASVPIVAAKERALQTEAVPRLLRRYSAGGEREIIARNLGISARNDYAILERIGGECAGAVTSVAHGQGADCCPLGVGGGRSNRP